MSTPEQRALLRQLNLKLDTFQLTDLLDELKAAEERANEAEMISAMIGEERQKLELEVTALSPRIAELESRKPEEGRLARGIVGYCLEHFYPEIKEPNILPDTLGMLTQISNMVTGLMRRPPAVSEAKEGSLSPDKS